MIRTPKEWTETCRECKGIGTIHKRQHFALWTPEEWLASMGSMEYWEVPSGIPSDSYVCHAMAGGTIFEACKEAVEISKAVGRPVAFEFNGAVAVLYADSDPVAVTKEWWVRAYGKTYEQHMAERRAGLVASLLKS